MKKGKLLTALIALCACFCVAGAVGCDKTETYTVTFDTNGGTIIASQDVKDGNKATKPENPTKSGYKFEGWYVGDEEWSFIGYNVTEDITLTAKWSIIGTTGLQYEKIDGKEEYACVGIGTATETDIRIASFYCGLPVTEIEPEAFEDCDSLTNVVIPDSVTNIGYRAFYDCYSLTSVVIGDSVTSIGGGAFSNCDSLRSVVIPDSVTNIGSSAFDGCIRLTRVVIPDSVTNIGYRAFYDCYSLTSVVIGDSVTSIGGGAFSNCDSLRSVVIPDSVTSIGSYAFYGCSSLTIYCEAESKPDSWAGDWNYSGCKVIWGHKGNNEN